ncbi:MAG TPA: hypothetical protein VEC57_02610 [Candidatus Limnocylindrales bacterium]|nr:hypothetical protein [Candidatus Limnocylindrales bacterium]
MPLSNEDIERYARQIVIPGIGASGQEALLAATVAVVGDEAGVEQVELYLRAAGPRVVRDMESATGAVVVAGVSSIDDRTRERILRSGVPALWYELTGRGFVCGVHPDARLEEAATSRRAADDGTRATQHVATRDDATTSTQHRAPADDDAVRSLLHRVAACDAAAAACAVILRLPFRSGRQTVDVLG